MRNIGILGASFNPIHVGHLIIAEQSLLRLNLDEVLFIPAFRPYHKNVELLNYHLRYKMTEDAISDNKKFKVSDIENNLNKNSYSYDIIRMLKKNENANYYFIIGSDSLKNLDTWYKYDDFLKMVKLVVFERPGYSVSSKLLDKYRNITELFYYDDMKMEISSTFIREQLKNKRYPRYLLLDNTIEFIKENKLWQ